MEFDCEACSKEVACVLPRILMHNYSDSQILTCMSSECHEQGISIPNDIARLPAAVKQDQDLRRLGDFLERVHPAKLLRASARYATSNVQTAIKVETPILGHIFSCILMIASLTGIAWHSGRKVWTHSIVLQGIFATAGSQGSCWNCSFSRGFSRRPPVC